MKNCVTLLLIVLLLTGFKDGYKLSEGIITLQFSYPDSAQISQKMLSVMPTEMVVYFRNGYTRAEYKNINNTVTIIDGKSQDGFTYYGVGTTFQSTKNERRTETELQFPGYRVKAGYETKEIAGITCRKAIVTYKPIRGTQRDIELWYTNELDVNPIDMEFKGINGFIMEYSYSDVIYADPEVKEFKKIMTCSKVQDTKVEFNIFRIGKNAYIKNANDIQRTNHVNDK